MAKLNNKKNKNFLKNGAFLLLLAPIVVIAGGVLAYQIYFFESIHPGIYVGGIYIGEEKPQEAVNILSKNISYPEKITLSYPPDTYEIKSGDINLTYDFKAAVRTAYELPRTGNFLYDLQKSFSLLFNPSNLGLRFSLNEEKLSESLSVIASEVSEEPIYPSIKLANGSVLVDRGKKGSELDIKKTRMLIGEAISLRKEGTIVLPLKEIDPTISESDASILQKRADIIKDKVLTLNFEYQTFSFKGNELLSFLDGKSEYNQKTLDFTVEKTSLLVEREPQDSVFVFESGRVNEFAPAKDGITVNKETLSNMIKGNLKTLEEKEEKSLSLDIPVERIPPKVRTEDVNNLGIKELLGRGSSTFRGSIANRVFNINRAASNFKGVLVAPGEIFSFNNVLGDVSELTGYKQAFVIKDGKTVLGDGGGVCQVSTTFFRAAMKAGLPIVGRRAHSYRVGYYEQDSAPGLDATVYAPTTDLKVKNDTPAHILIQSSVDPKTATIVFEIYGTSDGRVATTSKPVVSGVTPPPEDLYVDDPTLPSGQIKQIDFKAWGAKVNFNYKVERAGEVIFQKNFVSNYRPWQAVFLRGTGPVQ